MSYPILTGIYSPSFLLKKLENFEKSCKKYLAFGRPYVIIYTESEVRILKDKEKELFKLLSTVEKLVIRIISIVGWIKILIDIIK